MCRCETATRISEFRVRTDPNQASVSESGPAARTRWSAARTRCRPAPQRHALRARGPLAVAAAGLKPAAESPSRRRRATAPPAGLSESQPPGASESPSKRAAAAGGAHRRDCAVRTRKHAEERPPRFVTTAGRARRPPAPHAKGLHARHVCPVLWAPCVQCYGRAGRTHSTGHSTIGTAPDGAYQ